MRFRDKILFLIDLFDILGLWICKDSVNPVLFRKEPTFQSKIIHEKARPQLNR